MCTRGSSSPSSGSIEYFARSAARSRPQDDEDEEEDARATTRMTRLEDADADAVDVDATRCAIARVNNDVDAVNAKERAAACIITRLGTKRRKVRRGGVLFCTNAIATTTVCGIHTCTSGDAGRRACVVDQTRERIQIIHRLNGCPRED